MLVRAADDICRSSLHRLQGSGATGEIHNLDVQALGPEVTQLIGNGQWQVVERGLAANCNNDFGFFGLGLRQK